MASEQTFSGQGWRFPVSPREYKVAVKTLTGGTITLKVERGYTVRNIKNMIEVAENHPPSRQTLIFDGKMLCDSETLSFYGIGPRSKPMYLVLDLSGGGGDGEAIDSIGDGGGRGRGRGKRGLGKKTIAATALAEARVDAAALTAAEEAFAKLTMSAGSSAAAAGGSKDSELVS